MLWECPTQTKIACVWQGWRCILSPFSSRAKVEPVHTLHGEELGDGHTGIQQKHAHTQACEHHSLDLTHFQSSISHVRPGRQQPEPARARDAGEVLEEPPSLRGHLGERDAG